MAGEFRKLPIKHFPCPIEKKETSEQKYWKSFEFPTVVKEYTAINHVDFCKVKPYHSVVTCSGKIQIFAPYTNEVKRTYTRNKENYYGTKYRSDGKLLVVGGESGLVQILDATSRSILRNFHGHTKPTHFCTFGKESSHVFSTSDDKTVRCWDLASQKESLMIKAHKDYIRCGCTSETNSNHFVTGSYDHIVKIWDWRLSTVAMEMNHGAPVECVLMHPNGSLCLSAGSNYVKVWDILAGGKLFHQFSNHQKTITSLRFDHDCRRLLSGSLDRHVKVYNTQDNYAVIANIDYPSPILAMDISKDDQHLVVGMSDGAISLRHRPKSATGEVSAKRKRPLQPGSYRSSNQNTPPDPDSLVIAEKKYIKHTLPDKHLRKFRYHDALDAVLGPTHQESPNYVVSFLLELSRRDALEIALSKRTSKSLIPIVSFLSKNIDNPSYAKVLIPITNLLLDMYSHLAGQDFTFDRMITKLRGRLIVIIKNQKALIQLGGAIEQIISIATAAPDSDDYRPGLDPLLLLNGNISDNTDSPEAKSEEPINTVDMVDEVVTSESVAVETDVVMVNGHDESSNDVDVDFVIGASMVG